MIPFKRIRMRWGNVQFKLLLLLLLLLLLSPHFTFRKMQSRQKVNVNWNQEKITFEIGRNDLNPQSWSQSYKENLNLIRLKYHFEVVHPWRHANLDNFWPPPLSSRFFTKALILSSQNPWLPPPWDRDTFYGRPLSS